MVNISSKVNSTPYGSWWTRRKHPCHVSNIGEQDCYASAGRSRVDIIPTDLHGHPDDRCVQRHYFRWHTRHQEPLKSPLYTFAHFAFTRHRRAPLNQLHPLQDEETLHNQNRNLGETPVVPTWVPSPYRPALSATE